MIVEYDVTNNCYLANIQIKIDGMQRDLKAVIDTGATNTTIALSALVRKAILSEVVSRLDSYAQKAGISKAIIRGATKESGSDETYAYDACLENVIVGGHLIKRFHARIMINGAEGVCVIGNDFLNMCKYFHNAGEHQLTVENPIKQKYYESFVGKRVISNSQLNILLTNQEDVSSLSVF